MKIKQQRIVILLASSLIFILGSCKKDETTPNQNLNFNGKWIGTYISNNTSSFFSIELNKSGDLMVFASDSYYYASGSWSKNASTFNGSYQYASFPGTWNLTAQVSVTGSDTTMVGTWTDAGDASNKGTFQVVKKSSYPVNTLTYQAQSSWTCSGNDCQNVWEVFLVKGSATVGISNLTGGSMGQIALYAPGTTLGGSNLLTNDTKELVDCTQIGNCSNGAAGISKSITISTPGLYKFAATRNYGKSCGASGNFQVSIIADYPVSGSLKSSNTATLATGTTCK